MRPQKAKRVLNHICKNFYVMYLGDQDTLNRYQRGINSLIKNESVIDQLLDIAKKDSYQNWIKHCHDDEEYTEDSSYYPLNNLEQIYNNLFYIADKWNCVGRLKWLKEVISYFK